MALHSRSRVSLSTGRRSMAPLSASLECPSAEELQTSHEVKNHAHRRAKLKCDWYFEPGMLDHWWIMKDLSRQLE